MSGHGGNRKGAGRPLKWDFEYKLSIGQTCEHEWRKEIDKAINSKLSIRYNKNSELEYVWGQLNSVPVHRRKEFTSDSSFQEYLEWFEAEMKDVRVNEPEQPYHGVRLVQKPVRGTRKRIIAAVAEQMGLPIKTVDNMWQEYRRLEKALAIDDEAH